MLKEFLDSANYSMNPYSIPMFITAVLVLLLGIYVLIQDNAIVNKSFFMLTFSAFIWQAGIGLMYLMNDTGTILIFYKLFTFLGVVVIAPGIYFLTIASLGILEEKKRFLIAGYYSFRFLYRKLVDRLACSRRR